MTTYNMVMNQQPLPTEINDQMHPYLMRLVRAYHTTPVPAKQELMYTRYQLDGHLTMKLLAEDVNMEYNPTKD
jgi:hypothetical protein